MNLFYHPLKVKHNNLIFKDERFAEFLLKELIGGGHIALVGHIERLNAAGLYIAVLKWLHRRTVIRMTEECHRMTSSTS